MKYYVGMYLYPKKTHLGMIKNMPYPVRDITMKKHRKFVDIDVNGHIIKQRTVVEFRLKPR